MSNFVDGASNLPAGASPPFRKASLLFIYIINPQSVFLPANHAIPRVAEMEGVMQQEVRYFKRGFKTLMKLNISEGLEFR